MAIKIIDKFKPNNDSFKVADAQDVGFSPTESNDATNVQDAIENVSTKVDNIELEAENIDYNDSTTFKDGTKNVQKAIDTLYNTVNAKPYFAFVPSDTQMVQYDEKTKNIMLRTNISGNETVSIVVRNGSKIGGSGTLVIRNTTTNIQTSYIFEKAADTVIPLGSLSISGTYTYEITAKDSFGNTFKGALIDGNGDITTEYGDTTIGETSKLTVQVVYGKLSFINTSISNANEHSNANKNALIASRDLSVKNTVNVSGIVSYPEVSVENKTIRQILSYNICTQNVYKNINGEYKSIFSNGITLSKTDKLYYKYTKINDSKDIKYFEIGKFSVSNDDDGYKFITDTETNSNYKLDTSDVCTVTEVSGVKPSTGSERHDVANSSITLKISDLAFKLEAKYTINVMVSLDIEENAESLGSTTTSFDLYPSYADVINSADGKITDISSILVGSSPLNMCQAPTYDANTSTSISFSFITTRLDTIGQNADFSVSLYKYNSIDKEFDEENPIKKMTIPNVTHLYSFDIRLGLLNAAIYKLVVTPTLGNNTDNVGEPTIIYFNVNKSDSQNSYVNDNVIAYWDAEGLSNTDNEPNIWKSRKIDSNKVVEGYTDDFYIDLNGLDFSNTSVNGWTQFSTETNPDRSFLRFTGHSYGLAYYKSNSVLSPLTITDMINKYGNNRSQFSLEILYRTSCIGEMTACVLSSRKEESIDNPNYSYSDNDKIMTNPGITISYNKARFCTNKNYIDTPINENEWKHVVFVLNQGYVADDGTINGITAGDPTATDYNPISTIRIYVNGVLTSATEIPMFKSISNEDNRNELFGDGYQLALNGHITKIDTKSVDGFGNCDISMIRMYSKALDSNEVYTNYLTTFNRQTNTGNTQYNECVGRNSDKMPALYLIKNVNGDARKSGVTNVKFVDMLSITDKASSKSNAVNCTATYTYYDNNDTMMTETHNNVDVYLQGTSTLQFPIKNFRLRFYNDIKNSSGELVTAGANTTDPSTLSKYQKKMKDYVPGNKKDEWVNDYIYTLKADYMESAHLNNTPTAAYYKKVVEAVASSSISDSTNIAINGESARYTLYNPSSEDDKKLSESDIYAIDENGNFTPLNKYNAEHDTIYVGNKYKKISTANQSKILSPGRSYFEYLTEKDVYDNGSKKVFRSVDKNSLINDEWVNNLNKFGDLYIRVYEDGALKWVQYKPDDLNEAYANHIVYYLHYDYEDAILGFPCRVYIKDATDANDSDYIKPDKQNYRLIGTMMYNYDKTANAIGFSNKPVFEDEYNEYLYSVYNTSNIGSYAFTNGSETFLSSFPYNAFCKLMFALSGGNTTDIEIYTDASDVSILVSIEGETLTFKTSDGDTLTLDVECITKLQDVMLLDEFACITEDYYTETEKSDGSKKITVDDLYGTIPVYHYDQAYTKSENGKYVNDNGTYRYAVSGDTGDRYDQSINDYRTYDKDKDNNLIRTDVSCMISCEGATNTRYAAGTFYDIDKSYSETYETDYLNTFYSEFTEAVSSEPREIAIYDPEKNSYTTIISPKSADSRKALSFSEFTTALKAIPVANKKTADMFINNEDDLDKLIKYYNTAIAYSLATDGTVVFTTTSTEGNLIAATMEDAFYIDAENKKLKDNYTIECYDKVKDNIKNTTEISRYDFNLPLRSATIKYSKISGTKINTDNAYILVNSADGSGSYYRIYDVDKDKDVSAADIYERTYTNINYLYINDKKSYIGDSLLGTDDAYYNYITSSFEHRYVYTEEEDPVKDAIKAKYIDEDVNGWIPVKRIIKWVSDICDEYDSCTNDNDRSDVCDKFRSEFTKYFSLTYAATYYLQMMFLAQADNAGKNSMWDTWDGRKFYIRPYDMDTQCGLNNTGMFVIPPSAEINPAQSPRTIRVANAGNKDAGVSNYDTDWKTDNSHLRYKSFTTSTSRFWNMFYTAFKSKVNAAYADLRNSGIYTYDYIMGFYKSQTSYIIGETFYNYDMNTKYLSRADSQYNGSSATNSYLPLLMGNRIDQFGDWLRKRIIFCDSYFSYLSDLAVDTYSGIAKIRSDNTVNTPIGITVYSPTYIKCTVASDTNELTTFVDTDSTYTYNGVTYDGVMFTLPFVANNQEADISYIGNVREIRHFELVKPTDLNLSKAKKLSALNITNSSELKTLSLSNASYLRTLNISGCTKLSNDIDLSNAKNLYELSLANSAISSVSLCQGSPLVKFNAENVSLTNMKFIGLKNLKEISIYSTKNGEKTSNDITSLTISGCPLIQSLDLRLYAKLETLNIDSCDNLTNIDISKLENLKTVTIDKCPNLHVMNASECKGSFLNDLSLNNCDSLEILDISKSTCSNGVQVRLPASIKYFNASESGLSSIACGINSYESGIVDMQGILNLQYITFYSCKNIKTIKNLIYRNASSVVNNSKLSGAFDLFMSCSSLTTIENSFITYSGSLRYLFYEDKSLSDISSLQMKPLNNDDIDLYYALAYAAVDTNIFRNTVNYTRQKTVTETTATRGVFWTDDNTTKYKYEKISDINDIEQYADGRIYYCLGSYKYVKISVINNVIGSLNNIDSSYLVNGIVIKLNNKYYVYNNGWVELTTKNLYYMNIDDTPYYRLYTDSDKDTSAKKYIINYSYNKTTSAYGICREAILLSGKDFAIEDDSFDGLTRCTNLGLGFYSCKALENTINKNKNSNNPVKWDDLISHNAFNRLTECTSFERLFVSTKLEYLDYRLFKNCIKVENADCAFMSTGLKGFIDSDNSTSSNIIYKYYTEDKDGNMKSILPTTLINTQRMFSYCNLNAKENDINGLLSGLTNVTRASMMFMNNSSIESIANQPLKDLINCTNISGMFANCINLNVYNGNGIPNGMSMSTPFNLFDNTKKYIVEDAGSLFCGCTSLTGHISSGIFSNGENGAANLKYIGNLYNRVTNVDAKRYDNILGGAFANTMISSYNKEFIMNLKHLVDTSGLFAKFETSTNYYNISCSIPDKSVSTDEPFKATTGIDKYIALNGYYYQELSESGEYIQKYSPGIPTDIFSKLSDGSKFDDCSYMFMGNMLLYLSEEDLEKINSDKYTGTTLADKKRAWINSDSNLTIPEINNKLCYKVDDKDYSIFTNLTNLKSCAGMFANTSITYGDNEQLTWKNFDAVYGKLVGKNDDGTYNYNGIAFNDELLFSNNSKLIDISSLFANSIYHTPDERQISDKFLENCTNLKYAQSLFRNNRYQKTLPSTNMFNSCRDTLLYADSLFEGCINITGDICVGNDAPYIAYNNLLDDFKLDINNSRYSSISNDRLIDQFNTNESLIGFNKLTNDLSKIDEGNNKYSLKISTNELEFSNNYDMVLDTDPKLLLTSSTSEDIPNQYSVDSDKISEIKIVGTRNDYYEDNNGLYYQYQYQDTIGYVLITTYNQSISSIPDGAVISKNDDDSKKRFTVVSKLEVSCKTRSVDDLFTVDTDKKVGLINYPFYIYNLYKSNPEDEKYKASKINKVMYRCKEIVANGDNYDIELTSNVSFSNIDLEIKDTAYFILPANILTSNTVNKDYYKYSDGLFGSMPQLRSASRAFMNCQNITGAIPRDIFNAVSFSKRLNQLTDIGYIFAVCYKLGLTGNEDYGVGDGVYTYNATDKIYTQTNYRICPNTKNIHDYNYIKIYHDSNFKYKNKFDNDDKYLIPEDWLSNATNISNVSHMLQGTSMITGNNAVEAVTGNYAKFSTFGDVDVSGHYMIIPNSLFVSHMNISNASYAFANNHLASGNLNGDFLRKSLQNLTNVSYMLAYTAITSFGITNSTRIFERDNDGTNNKLSNIKYVFVYCGRVRNVENTFPQFKNIRKFSNITDSEGAFYYTGIGTVNSGDYINIMKGIFGEEYENLYKTLTNTGYYDYSLGSAEAKFAYNTSVMQFRRY